jgi:hypothetical protein
VSQVGATTALRIDAASFLVSAALVAAVVPAVKRAVAADAPRRYLSQLAEGPRFIWSQRLFRALVATILVTNFLDAPFPVVMPVFAREAFGGAAELGLL